MKNEVKRVEISESETLPFNSQLVRVKQLDTDQKFGKKENTFDYREQRYMSAGNNTCSMKNSMGTYYGHNL